MTAPVIAPVLFIGGMDSSGGAGLLRDAATALALGAPHRVAVTAVTAQSDRQVAASLPMPSKIVDTQIALAADARIGAAKTGMLVNRAVVEAVAAGLPPVPLVVDPVLCASSGGALLDREGLAALIALLLPRATVLTPNLPELQALGLALGRAATADEAEVVAALLARGCGAVLVKGGHEPQGAMVEDRLYRPARPPLAFRGPRQADTLRGTGCQLASALAVGLAQGWTLPEAVESAKAAVMARFLR